MIQEKTITSELLAKHAAAEETHAVVIELHEVGSTYPFQFSGKLSKTYVFRYCNRRCRHVLIVPASVWMADGAWMARDIMERRNRNILVPLVEPLESAVIVPPPPVAFQATEDAPFDLTDAEIDERAAAVLGA